MPETKEIPETTALQKASPQPTQIQRQQETFAPRNLADAIKFAELVAKSGMAPKDYANKPEAIVVAIQMGMEVGLQPMQSLQNIAVINGRPALWGDGALAVVKAHPDFEFIREDDIEVVKATHKAVCVVKRRNQPEVRRTFSEADAKTAGLWGKRGREGQPTPWVTYPERMLQMRARGFALRDAFPDALKGIITAEEAMDIPPETIIQGGPLVESTPPPPDPNEQPITMDEATAYYKTWKASGWTIEQAKENTLRIAGVTSSKEIKRKNYEACMTWANSKPPVPESAQAQQQAPQNPDAEPCADGNQ